MASQFHTVFISHSNFTNYAWRYEVRIVHCFLHQSSCAKLPGWLSKNTSIKYLSRCRSVKCEYHKLFLANDIAENKDTDAKLALLFTQNRHNGENLNLMLFCYLKAVWGVKIISMHLL